MLPLHIYTTWSSCSSVSWMLKVSHSIFPVFSYYFFKYFFCFFLFLLFIDALVICDGTLNSVPHFSKTVYCPLFFYSPLSSCYMICTGIYLSSFILCCQLKSTTESLYKLIIFSFQLLYVLITALPFKSNFCLLMDILYFITNCHHIFNSLSIIFFIIWT